MTREQLLRDLRRLLEEHASTFPDWEAAPELGFRNEPKLTAMRRLLTGQTVAISIRYLRAIVAELDREKVTTL